MIEKNVNIMYFLDFLNNNLAIWLIRIIVLAGLVITLTNYLVSHKKYKNEFENKGGK